MTLIDRVLLMRANEQSALRLVLRRDLDEPKKLDRTCSWCSVSLNGTRSKSLCVPCKQAGRTATQCKWGCGRYVTRTDQTGPWNKELRNVCGTCRDRLHAQEALS